MYAHAPVRKYTHLSPIISSYVRQKKKKISTNPSPLALSFSGRMRQEVFDFIRCVTFRSDYNDHNRFSRSKANIDIDTHYYPSSSRPARLHAHARFTAFTIWGDDGLYTPPTWESVFYQSNKTRAKAAMSSHDHEQLVPVWYAEEGWLSWIPFVTDDGQVLMECKVGYFPFVIGRGIALGDYFDGAVSYLGWQTPANPGNGTQRSPGCIIHYTISPDLHVTGYYSLWRGRSFEKDDTREHLYHVMFADTSHPRGERGVSNQRHIAACVFSYTAQSEDKKMKLQPYGFYVSAPELTVERAGDASCKALTMGCMAEYEVGPLALNIEGAYQVGTHTMHALDRNHTIIEDAYYHEEGTSFLAGIPAGRMDGGGRLDHRIGIPASYHSHITLGVTTPTDGKEYPLPYRAAVVPSESKVIAHATDQQKAVIRNPDGSDYHSSAYPHNPFRPRGLYSTYQPKTGIDYYDVVVGLTGQQVNNKLYNADLPFAYGKRFRPAYTLNLQGFMGLIDCIYTVSPFFQLTAAAAYISGDDYPFDTEIDRTYKGFIPFKDPNYVGVGVKAYGMLAARKLGRPTTFSKNLMYAPINYESMHNLSFIGGGFSWYLDGSTKQLHLEANVVSYWQPVPPYKWDRYKKVATSRTDHVFAWDIQQATQQAWPEGQLIDFGNTRFNGIYNKLQKELHFFGGPLSERASSHLGIECNMVLTYRPLSACELKIIGALFKPGLLYKETQGMPNPYTTRVNKKGEIVLDSHGTHMALGIMARLTYWF